jgi:hypothetical protein
MANTSVVTNNLSDGRVDELNRQRVGSVDEAIKVLTEIKKEGGDLQKSSILKGGVEKFTGRLDIYNVDTVIDALQKIGSSEKPRGDAVQQEIENKKDENNVIDLEKYKKEKAEQERKDKVKTDVGSEIEKLSQKITDNLKGDEKLKKEMAEELEIIIKQDKIRSSKDEVTDLADKISKNLGREKDATIEIEAKKAQLEADKWQEENIEEVREYRKNNFKEELEKETRKQNPNITEEQMVLVKKEGDLIADIYYGDGGIENQKNAALEVNKDESVGRLENSWSEVQGITGILRKTPKEFNKLQGDYKQIKDGLGNVNLPFEKFSNLRSFEGIMNSLQGDSYSQLFGGIESKFAWLDRIDSFTGGRISQTVVRWGGNFASKIGNQAASEFVQNSVNVLAKEGFQNGFKSLMQGILSGGVKAGAQAGATAAAAAGTAAAGTAAAAGATAAATATAATAATGVGLPVAAVMAAIQVALFLKKQLGKVAEKLGISMKGFMEENFGKIGGKIMGGLAMLVALPTLLIGMISTVVLAPILLCVFGGMFIYQMFQGSMVSSLVPPTEKNGASAEITPGPSNPGSDPTIINGAKCSVADKVVLTNQRQNIPMRADGGCSGKTLGSSGCGPTSVSEILQGKNKDWGPSFLLNTPGSPYYNTYQCDQGTTWQAAVDSFKKYLGSNSVNRVVNACSNKDLEKIICDDHAAVMIRLTWPGGGHYIVGVAVAQNGEIIIKDPNGAKIMQIPSSYPNKTVADCLEVSVN